MALVAGCRPQFLLGSFLLLFLMKDEALWAFKYDKKMLLRKLAVTAAPFLAVAAGLMVYNFVRFGSPIDFGANYNLTTNDMTQRGFSVGRLRDGLFMYLFQLPNIGTAFPYVYPTDFHSGYIGVTIREAMFGGALFAQPVLLALFALPTVKQELKKKKLFGIVTACIVFAVFIVCADTQMAGILSRYYADFVWLLLIAAGIVLFALWESIRSPKGRRILTCAVLICGIFGICMQLGMGVHTGEMESRYPEIYYALKAFFL